MLLATLAWVTIGGTSRTIYVAPWGNDGWSGAFPERHGVEGPLATLDAARLRVRRLKSGGPVKVLIRAGRYWLDKAVTFSPEDSGSPSAPVVYAAYKNEKPEFSGGRLLTDWSEKNGRWVSHSQDPAWNFSQLFVNGQRRYRPRLPKKGYFEIAEGLSPSPLAPVGKGSDRFRFNGDDLHADLKDAEIVDVHQWSVSRSRVASVDTRDNSVTFTAPVGYPDGWAAFSKGSPYFVDNVGSALSDPGEWYLDRSKGLVSYLPQTGETVRGSRIVAPRLSSLVEFRGDVSGANWVHDIQFRGLTFEHTNWNLGPEGRFFPQAEADLQAAIDLNGARRIVLRDCSIQHTGTYAIDAAEADQDIDISSCRMLDLGAGGVKIGTMAKVDDPERLTQRVRVENCLIAGGGRVHPAAVGVWIGQSSSNTIDHNTISDFYYTGISVGWSWGYAPTSAHDNTISNNLIQDIGQGVLSDMGGIYCLGIADGTRLTGNVIHDVISRTYGGWGIYPDEGSTHLVIADNLVYRTKSAGFHQHYGQENQVTNNVFAFGGEAQMMRTRAEDHLSFTSTHNILLGENAHMLGSNWTGSGFHSDDNLFWTTSESPLDMAGQSWAVWQTRGFDTHSLVADPMFVDPSKGDFRLKRGSPALKVGFKPVDWSHAGCTFPVPAKLLPAWP